jgi:8-oxo-dGTP pyrophosphatase MutT (NUDIX family)
MPPTGAGIILFNKAHTHILLIKDSRSKKWSMPKGQYESYDDSYLSTAIRETFEETGLQWCYDYLLDKISGTYGKYVIFEGSVLSDTLRKTSCPEQNVESIEWVDLININNYITNLPTSLWLTNLLLQKLKL